MFLEPLWTALPFVQWEDTLSFHAKLFRCFLLSLLDAHTDLAFISQGSERILAVLGQKLAGVGLHDPISHRAPRYNDGMMRCPPKRIYKATSLPSFVATAPMDQMIAVFPAFVPQPINMTHNFYEEPTLFAVPSDLPGSARVLLAPGVVACIFLWTLTLAIVVSRSSNTEMARSISTRTRPLPQDRPSIEDGIQSLLAGITEDVDHLASMPGAWLHERRKQNTFETRPEPVFDMMAWRIIYSCAQEAWTRFPGATLTFTASGPLDHDSSDIVTVERTFDDGDSLACQGSGSNEVDLDAGIPFPVVDCSPSESSLSIQNPRESTTVMDNRHESSTTGDVAIKDLDSAQTTIPDTIREDGLTFALVASSDADRVLCQDDTSSDSDESASGNQTDGTEGEGLFGIGAQRPDISALEREDEYRALGRRQDGALSDTGCPLLLRRVRSTGYLSRRRDVFNDGDDSYWTEQVNARLSPCRYGWSEVSSWPPEGREDETDNWRTRNSQVTNSAESEKASDEHASFSDRAGSDDGPPGIYVVPQKRGRMTGGRPRSPVSSPRTSDYTSGLGFFPFRKTPSLLTPEAWRPGCLYIPDPPVDESIQADAWWDSLSSVRTGHVFDAGTVNQDVPEEQGPSRDPHGGQVSWRDRYENDPASRRFNAVHRRAMTEG